MRKETIIMTTASHRAYVRPLITAVVPAALVLQSASPESPPVIVDPHPGQEALSKKLIYDPWEDDDEETSERTFDYD